MGKGIILDTVTVELRGDASQMDAAFKKAAAQMRDVGAQLESLGKSMMLKVTLPLVGLGTEIVKVFGEQEDAIAKVKAVLAATGGQAGITADHITNLSMQLQAQTRFFHTDIDAAAGTLLVFKKIQNQMGEGNDIFDRTLKVSMSLAEVMGRDLQAAVISLGRAFEDPEQGLVMLRRAGIVFSQDQIAMIKDLEMHNHLLEAQRMILDGIEGSMKNVAQAMSATPLGQLTQTWNTLKDAMIAAGQAVTPLVLTVAKTVKDAAANFEKLNLETRQWVVSIGLVASALGPALYVVGKLISLVGGLQAVTLSLGLAWSAGSAFVVGLAAITAAYIQMKEAVAGANAAMATSTQVTDLGLQSMDPDKAYAAALQLEHTISSLTIQRNALQHEMRRMNATTPVGDNVEMQNAIRILNESIMAYERQFKILLQVADTKKQIAKTPIEILPKEATLAIEEFEKSIGMISNDLTTLIGKSFPSAKDQAEAYFKLIEKLTAAHVGLDVALRDLGGRTLRDLARDYLIASQSALQEAQAQEQWNRAMERARTLTEKALTPLQQLRETQADLMELYLGWGVTWDQYEQAMKGAQKVYEDATGQTFKWGQAVKEATQQALESMLDFSAFASMSFRQFTDSVMRDLDRLAAKILASEAMRLIMKVLATIGPGLAAPTMPDLSGISIPNPSVPFIPGPLDNISFGGAASAAVFAGSRSGVASPAFAQAGGSVARGGDVHLALTIQAVDSKSFADLAAQNPDAIIAPMLHALRKSSMLQTAMGR